MATLFGVSKNKQTDPPTKEVGVLGWAGLGWGGPTPHPQLRRRLAKQGERKRREVESAWCSWGLLT